MKTQKLLKNGSFQLTRIPGRWVIVMLVVLVFKLGVSGQIVDYIQTPFFPDANLGLHKCPLGECLVRLDLDRKTVDFNDLI